MTIGHIGYSWPLTASSTTPPSTDGSLTLSSTLYTHQCVACGHTREHKIFMETVSRQKEKWNLQLFLVT